MKARPQMPDSHGALLGWTSQNLGDRVVLKLESAAKAPPFAPEDVHAHLLVMDRVQAVQLGHYLFRITGETAPKLRKGFLRRLFGK
jgi:hypothetical protein